MSELLGKNFRPVVASAAYKDDDVSKRLVVVCRAARDVLLKFVKKDADLTPYPGPIQVPAALFAKKSTFTETMPAKPPKQRDHGHVSFADEVEYKGSSVEEDDHHDYANFEETTDQLNDLEPHKPELHMPMSGSSADTNIEKSPSTKSGSRTSSIQLDTPAEDDWGMSPIAPSVSTQKEPIQTNASIEDSTGPSPSPPFLSPILRQSSKDRPSASKKLNVSFSSTEATSGDKKAAAQVARTAASATPMSDISDDFGGFGANAGAKKQKTSSKKPVVIKMGNAASSPAAFMQLKRSSRSPSSSSRSSARSTKSKSSVVDDSDLDFKESDDVDSEVPIKRQKKKTTRGGAKRKPQSASSTSASGEEEDEPSPPKRRRGTTKRGHAAEEKAATGANKVQAAKKGKPASKAKARS